MHKTSAKGSHPSQPAELERARAREAALRDVLQVISVSRNDDRPVFDAVLRSAQALCGADAAALLLGRAEDPHLTLAALQQDNLALSEIDAFIAATNRPPMRMDPALHVSSQAICSGQIVHIADLSRTQGYLTGETTFRFMVEDQGLRTTLSVPLFDAQGAIGAISLHRREVRLFSDDEIALIQSFAAHAVIAIENVRQFRAVQKANAALETRLAREAATREILEVISHSRDDYRPVFDAILQNATRLCGADSAALVLGTPEGPHMTLAALWDWGSIEPEALDGFVADVNRVPIPLDPKLHVSAQAICSGAVVQIADVAKTEGYLSGERTFRIMVEERGIRTVLSVPMFDANGTLGAINLNRREVRLFSEDEVALIQSFAAQAVIAIENVRQFRELQTRLAREAATREILEVISQSRDDDRPVFDVVLRKAADLCNASLASLLIISEDRRHALMVAEWGHEHASDTIVVGKPIWKLESALAPTTCMREGRIVHIHDMADTDLYRSGDPLRVAAVEEDGIRTFLAVPLFGGGQTVGCILVYRREVRPFTADEIALVETFAAQAVIAIENVRQFRELQDSLEQQEATSDILRVISQSREDETQVFDLILEKAAVLCDADQSSLFIVNAARTHVHHMADWGHDRTAYHPGLEYSLDLPLSIVPTIRTAKVVHIEDYSQSVAYKDRDPMAVGLVETEGVRTRLIVPLLQNGIAIGCISLSRRVVRPFSPDEIALVETFAAQAVIAIENVRQFRELQTRLAREAATREILEVISQSRDDDRPVFDVVLRKAAELCHASMAGLNIISEDRSYAVMVAEWGDHVADLQPVGETVWPMDSDHVPSTCMREGRIVHCHDLADTDLYRSGDRIRVTAVDAEGIRTFLAVPLFSGGQTVSCITIYRREVRPFTPDEIALVETFAAQAVIAIENVRQFRELQTRLEREAATREILEVISQSRDDDRPVFDAVLRNANRLCGTSMAHLMLGRPDDTHMTLAAYVNPYLPSQDAVEQVIAFSNQTGMRMNSAEHFSAQAILSGEVVQIADLATSRGYLSGEPTVRILVEDVGVRTILSVPLFDAQGTIGAISLHRREPQPFGDDEITLIQSFAAQAVIAIENVRQFRELQTRLAREAATREILEVISRNPDDDRPVFDVILRNAIALCAGDTSALLMGRKDDPRMTMVAWRDRESGSSVMDDAMIAQMNATEMLMDPRVHVSAQAIVEARNIHLLDVTQHPSYLAGELSYRIMGEALGVRSALVVPLIDARGALGTVHVHRRQVRPFTNDEIALVETFAAQAVIAIENVRQFKALEALNAELGDRVHDQVGEIERMGRLKRFLPSAVADAVVSSGSERMLKSHRALLGVLFCDIRGFTAFCETAEPEETIEVLQTYHEEMGHLIEAHGAGVDHRMGDGIMVLFNDPLPCDDPAGSAVRLGMAMRDRMAALCIRWKKMGHRLGFGVGISLGYATVGMVGSGGRQDYTASGTAVNLAARLCDEALDGEILVSPRAATAVEGSFAVEGRGERSLKGIREPVELFRVTSVFGG